MQKIHGFPGTILQIVMNGQIDQSVRQSGAIYLKNFCSHFWMEREVIGPDGDALSNFAVHESDKQVILKKSGIFWNYSEFFLKLKNYVVHPRQHSRVNYCFKYPAPLAIGGDCESNH